MMPYLTCGVWKNSVSTPIPTTTPPQSTASPLPLFFNDRQYRKEVKLRKKNFDPIEKGKHMTHNLATKMALSGLKLSTRGNSRGGTCTGREEGGWAPRGRLHETRFGEPGRVFRENMITPYLLQTRSLRLDPSLMGKRLKLGK